MGSSERIDNLGMEGEMGRAIAFYHLFRQTGDKEWKEKAETLLDEIIDGCSVELPLTYGDGLCGVGVGVEYLIQEGFVEGDSNEILCEMDSLVYHAINCRALSGLEIDDGVCGLAYYLYFRLRKRKELDSISVLRNKEHLIYLIDWIADLLPATKHLSTLYEVFFILCQLHTLNVLNAKVEKLIEYCLKEISLLSYGCSNKD